MQFEAVAISHYYYIINVHRLIHNNDIAISVETFGKKC